MNNKMANVETGHYNILDDLRKLIKIKFAEKFTVALFQLGNNIS